MSDAELVRAMREGSYEALREFYLRFEPLLARYAARAGVLCGSWEEDAHDVLGAVVLSLVERGSRAKERESVRDIHAYIQRAFRNHLLDARRSFARREQRDTRATSSADETGERMALAISRIGTALLTHVSICRSSGESSASRVAASRASRVAEPGGAHGTD